MDGVDKEKLNKLNMGPLTNELMNQLLDQAFPGRGRPKKTWNKETSKPMTKEQEEALESYKEHLIELRRHPSRDHSFDREKLKPLKEMEDSVLNKEYHEILYKAIKDKI